MNAWIRHKAIVAAMAAFALCAAFALQQAPLFYNVADPQPLPAILANSADDFAEPIAFTFEKNADWHQSVAPPKPDVLVQPLVTAPNLNIAVEENTQIEVLELAANPPIEVEKIRLKVPVSLDMVFNEIPEQGELVQTSWAAGESLHGAQTPTPVLVAQGNQAGPTVCITAAVHGDELNGIESVRRLMYSIKPEKLKGKVVGVPIVNLQGFQRHSRYLADRRDLNRFFPGNPRGSSAARMAYSFFNEIILNCDGLVDLHTGSFHRTNLPQLRADLNNADVLALTKGFGATTILHSEGGQGTLRRAATDAGIAAVTLEAGEPLRLQEDAVAHTVKALFTLLDAMGMYNKRSFWGNPEPTYYSSAWVRADQGGILKSEIKLGKRVKSGELLGVIIDPISNEQVAIHAPYAGRIIGMAVNQFVMPGYAAFHLATEAELDEVSEGDDFHSDGLDVAVTDSAGEERSE